MITLYIVLIPGSKAHKNEKLSRIIDAIVGRYKDFIPDIAVDITPRFNMKINDLVYIAGGDGFLKGWYKDLVTRKNFPPYAIYSKGYMFIKGYEFEYDGGYEFDKVDELVQSFGDLCIE